MDYAHRLERLRGGFAAHDIDGLIVSDILNSHYLTGFPASHTANSLLIITETEQWFFTDGRFKNEAENIDSSWTVEILAQNLFQGVLQHASMFNAFRLGIEDSISVENYSRLENRLQVVPAHHMVESLRAVKDQAEIEHIRAAAGLLDVTYEHIQKSGIIGKTEREVAWNIETFLRGELQADALAFETIVGAEENGANPHARPSGAVIEADTFVVLDFGARLDNYCSDCTRTFATGELSSEARKVYELVRLAQEEALKAIRPGVACGDIHQIAREVIADGGYGEYFNHGTGHGVGLDIHEEPRIGNNVDKSLEVGNVVTVEPGIYLPGKWGVRIEDLVVVCPDGAERLTNYSKKL